MLFNNIRLSALELAVVREGGTAAEAIASSVKVAQHAEQLGFERVWFAEHHNMPHVASSAPQLLIAHTAEHTNRIRVGSGGVMLPNHTPLLVAEQFGTLETLFPGRIDLGLGRAPGTDQLTAAAIRKNNMHRAMSFEEDVLELQAYLGNKHADKPVRAFPAEGLDIPIWILGSSPDSAVLASGMGLPYAFASHFSTTHFERALEIYRKRFKPSKDLSRPYIMAGINVVAADTQEEAEHLATSLYKMFLGIVTGQRKPLQPPGALPEIYFDPEVKQWMDQALKYTFVGTVDKIREELKTFISRFQLDELIVSGSVFDLQAKLHSLELLKEALSV